MPITETQGQKNWNKYGRENAWKYREKKNFRANERNKENRIKALELLGNKCDCCNENRFEFLAIDHIDGNGYQIRKTYTNQQTVRDIAKTGNIEGYRILCHNCNVALGIYKRCPHKVGVENE